MKCDVIAKAIVAAARATKLKLPMVVRLAGNRVEEVSVRLRITLEMGNDKLTECASILVARYCES